MLLYYITDRTQFLPEGRPADFEGFRQARLLATVEAACAAGVDFVQLREKDLSARQLETLASRIVAIMRRQDSGTRLLINSRTDVAISVGADGVHLRSAPADVSAAHARAVLSQAEHMRPIVGVSCHNLDEVRQAAADGADFTVFGPVFGKQDTERQNAAPAGVRALASACKADGGMPVLAIGGVTTDNARQCMEAGVAGVAGIRLFQDSSIGETVAKLRRL